MDELDLFAAAIAVGDPLERNALLDRECAGRPDLRRRLEMLLDAHARSHQLFDAPHHDNLNETTAQFSSEQPGEIIAGRYKLLELIGEGGMGAVWAAEQSQPVRRKVALKLIKAGMDSRSVLARFEQERQALALMDHPSIAKVLDGGLTDRGRPYFVMEYVKGVPITDYCDAARLNVSDRLALFVQVCHAVQHAHQKGIIHRDLKPSNILVAPYDDKPIPKIIDFGLAKAMHQSLTERTIHTAHESVLGTPLYMSPEQAQLNNLDVDTRSDVFSLGVLLYELLTGTTPLEKKRFKEAAWDEVRRLIREEEPPRPSARLSSTDTLPSIAAGRQTEPLRLAKLVRGELDWIVMKALEKDRTRRYETANGFAMDVARFLSGEPVLAHPPSNAYKLRKFAQRHKTQVGAAGLVLAALLMGMVGIAYGFWQAEAARTKLVAAWTRESDERIKAESAKADAQAKEAEANAVVKFFEDRVFAAGRPKGEAGGLGHNVSLHEAIDASLTSLGTSFKDQPLVEARLRMALGSTFEDLGDYPQAAEQFEQARALYTRHRGPDHRDTLGSMNNLANCYYDLSRHTEALRLREETLIARKRVLPPDHPDTLTSMNNVANSYAALNRHADALKLRQETLAAMKRVLPPDHPDTLTGMNNLAISYSVLNRHAEALKLREETLAAQKRVLPADHPHTLTSMMNLAINYAALNRHAEALKLSEETLAAQKRVLPPDHPDTLLSMHNLASSYHVLNRHADALKLREETLAAQKRVLPPGHSDTLKSMNNLAISYAAVNRHGEALSLIDEFLAKANRPGVDPSRVSNAIRLRLRCCQKLSDVAGCRASVEMLEKRGPADANSFYNVACYRAVTASLQAKAKDEGAAKLANEDADKAMAWLHKTVAAGYTNAALMKKDADLEFLRDRDDFKKLLAGLETNAKQ